MTVVLGPNIPVMVKGDLGDAYLAQGNAFLRMFQHLIQPEVISVTLATPPGGPVNGDRYIVPVGGLGLWVGHDTAIAMWSTNNPAAPAGEWEFFTPLHGWLCFNQADEQLYVFKGGAWVRFTLLTSGYIAGSQFGEIDSGYIKLRDDFVMPSIDKSLPLGTFTSEESWLGLDGSGGESQFFDSSAFPNAGLIFLGANAVINTTSFLLPHLITTSVQQYGWPIFDYPGWKLVWIFGVSRKGAGSVPPAFDWSHVSAYIGLGSWPGQTSNTPGTPRPSFFAGLRYDSDATAPAISDNQFVFEYVAQTPVAAGAPVRNNTQGTVQATGITPVEGRFYRFEMTYSVDGQILYSLSDGVTTFTSTLAIARKSLAPTATVLVSNGIATYTSPGVVEVPWAAGSKIVISGATGTTATLNGTNVLMPANLQNSSAQWITAVAPFGSQNLTNGTTAFYPALVPFVAFGNSSEAGPTAKTKGLLIDFFGFLWNKGIASPGAVPSGLLSRYF